MDDGTEHGQSVMVGLLPIVSDWSKIEIPHLTLVYAGEIPNLAPSTFNELAKDACSLAALARPLTLSVTGKDLFGEEDDTLVLTLRLTPELMGMRRFLERWNASEHPFQPHVTVGPRDTQLEVMPSMIAFDRIVVGWGKEYLSWKLTRN